jgi:hypothetical protein
MTTQLEVLEQEEQDLLNKLQAIREEIYQVKLDACPIKVGAVITARRDNQEYLVVKIVKPEGDWIKAVPRKKDGAWSKSARQFYGLESFTETGNKEPCPTK